MSNEIFDFPYHQPNTRYPEGAAVQFGSSWVYTAKPSAPDQRRFQLTFTQGMQYFFVDTQDTTRGDIVTSDGMILSAQRPRSAILSSSNKVIAPSAAELIGQRNILALEQFYRRHLQWDTFMYPHTIHGLIKCRFLGGFTSPRILGTSTGGLVEGFSITFLEMF